MLVGIACADGELDVDEGEETSVTPANANQDPNTTPPSNQNSADQNSVSPPQDTGIPPEDTWQAPQDTGSPTEDTDSPTDDTDPPPEDTDPPPEDTDPPPEDTEPQDCCPIGEVECISTGSYRECVADNGSCGDWVESLQCPSGHECNSAIDAGDPCEPLCSSDHPEYGNVCTVGQGVCQESGTMHCADAETLECNATAGDPEPKQCNNQDSNCDGIVDSQGICGPCIDDGFAPDNFVSQSAPHLGPGQSFEDLVLCDNENPDVTSHNFFYLGQVSHFQIHLEWEEVHGPLGLDFWTATTSQATWQDREFLADAGQHPSELSHSQSVGSSLHVFARVFFRTVNKPPAGTPYTISHSN